MGICPGLVLHTFSFLPSSSHKQTNKQKKHLKKQSMNMFNITQHKEVGKMTQ